jgi:hypothetical protein
MKVESGSSGTGTRDKSNAYSGSGGEGGGDGKKKKKSSKPKPMEKRLLNAERDTQLKLRSISTLQATIASSSVASVSLVNAGSSSMSNTSKGDGLSKMKGREKEGDILLEARKPVVDCMTLIMQRLLVSESAVNGLVKRSTSGRSKKGGKAKDEKVEKKKKSGS